MLLRKLLIVTFILFSLVSCRLVDSDGTGHPSLYIYNIGHIDTSGFAYGVTTAQGKAFVADGYGGVVVVDVSMPHFPVQAVTYADDASYYNVVIGSSDYVFAAAGQEGFKIIDLFSPFGPETIGNYNTYNAYDLDYAGDYVFIADDFGGVRILNISSVHSVYEFSNFNVTGQNVYSVTLNWPHLFVGARYGFSIFNIENLYAPSEIHFEALSIVNDIFVAGHLAYIAHEGGLSIFDISSPNDPQELGFIFLPATARSVSVRGDFAYLTLGREGLSIVRIDNPHQPVEVAFYRHPTGEMSALSLMGRYMLIASGSAGLLILEFWPGHS